MHNRVNGMSGEERALSEIGTNATTAYGDESVRMAGAPPFYMLGVALMSDATPFDLERIKQVMPARSKKLHWRDMNEGLQKKSLRMLADIERTDLVVIASPLTGHKQERARRKCLETLLPILEERNIEDLILESRKPMADKLDINYVKYAKGAKFVKSINVTHEDGADQPRLWIADQVLGAMGDYLTRTGGWDHWKEDWEALNERVERIDVRI